MAAQQLREDTSTTAEGVSVFAGVVLVTLAAFEILQGFSAVLSDDLYVTGVNYIYELDVTAWGWWHMILGAVGVAVGVGILNNKTWANVAGIAIAVVSALSQFMFLPYYPFWAILIIALDVLVIWALTKQIGRRRP